MLGAGMGAVRVTPRPDSCRRWLCGIRADPLGKVMDEFDGGRRVFEHGGMADSPEHVPFSGWRPRLKSAWVHPLVLVANATNRNGPAGQKGSEITLLEVPVDGCSRRNIGVHAPAAHAVVLRHRDKCVAKVVSADSGRQSLVVNQRGHCLAEARKGWLLSSYGTCAATGIARRGTAMTIRTVSASSRSLVRMSGLRPGARTTDRRRSANHMRQAQTRHPVDAVQIPLDRDRSALDADNMGSKTPDDIVTEMLVPEDDPLACRHRSAWINTRCRLETVLAKSPTTVQF
jgi:hypothetical protein